MFFKCSGSCATISGTTVHKAGERGEDSFQGVKHPLQLFTELQRQTAESPSREQGRANRHLFGANIPSQRAAISSDKQLRKTNVVNRFPLQKYVDAKSCDADFSSSALICFSVPLPAAGDLSSLCRGAAWLLSWSATGVRASSAYWRHGDSKGQTGCSCSSSTWPAVCSVVLLTAPEAAWDRQGLGSPL